MALEDLKKGFSDTFSSVGEKLKDSLSVIKDLKDAGSEKLSSLVNDVLGLAPLIEETGFAMKDVSVDIGIPPGVSLSFVKEKDIDPETIDKILKENEDKELLKVIVKALEKADAMQKGMNLTNYNFKGLTMKLGLPPDVSLKFERK